MCSSQRSSAELGSAAPAQGHSNRSNRPTSASPMKSATSCARPDGASATRQRHASACSRTGSGSAFSPAALMHVTKAVTMRSPSALAHASATASQLRHNVITLAASQRASTLSELLRVSNDRPANRLQRGPLAPRGPRLGQDPGVCTSTRAPRAARRPFLTLCSSSARWAQCSYLTTSSQAQRAPHFCRADCSKHRTGEERHHLGWTKPNEAAAKELG